MIILHFKFHIDVDSDFFYQMNPSVDIAVLDVDPNFLKQRTIKALKFAKPDNRFPNFATIGFQNPRKITDSVMRRKYGASGMMIQERERLYCHRGKSIAFGQVRSYGGVTSVVVSGTEGMQGAPVINE